MSPERLVPPSAAETDLVRRHLARYRFASSYVAGQRVLDVACGSGYGADLLALQGAREVVGVDIAADAVSYATRRYERPGLRFVQLDATQIGPLGLFDRIISFETIEHLERPESFLQAVSNTLSPDGLFMVSTPKRERGTLEDRPENPFHIREWDELEFGELLHGFFASVEMYYQGGFESLGFPGSRTLQRTTARLLYPSTFRESGIYQVLPNLPKFHGLRFSVAYYVAVCRRAHRSVNHV